MTDEGRRRHDATRTAALGVPLPPRPTAVLSAGGTVAGRYEVRGVLGSGGFAVVYLAVDRESGDEVALKVLHPERVDAASLRRLRREAEIANRTASPHLVRVRDVGLDGDAPYLALERVRGESLAQRLDGEPLPVEEALRLARGILAGLEDLHRQGVLHRDVKPGNVLLADDGRVMLVDFGLALSEQHAAPGDVTQTRATAAEAVLGTVEYLSPEQALAEEVDPRSDLYSFGVVLFEMLTGRLPHRARSALGTLVAHIQEPAPDVRRLRQELPVWLAAVVARLLAKKAEERYPSAAAVSADLERRRASGVWRRTGRRWWPRVLAAVLAAVLVAAGLQWLAVRPDGPVFSHVRQGGDALQGISDRGTVLWTLPGTYGDLLPARLKPGEPRRLVGFPRSTGYAAAAQPVPLSVLDPSTGQVVRRVEMPTAAQAFPGMSNRYTPRPTVLDLDGDGLDEVIVGYSHSPYWPSYTVLYEPRIERTRVAFTAAGHHRLAASAELDGDGDPDLLFTGIANRMGWYTAAAAVALDPPVNTHPGTRARGATTPDHAVAHPQTNNLIWYALLPRMAASDRREVKIDASAERITYASFVGPALVLDFDGFPAARRHPLRPDERNALRRDAHRRLREARRLSAVRHVDGAVAEARAARRLAERAGAPYLAEWSRRSEGVVLARGGRREAAEALFRELAATSEHAAEIAFDAAAAFHLGGDPERAATWYRRGLGPGGSEEVGRGRYEYLHGLVFAHLEAGRTAGALAEIARYRAGIGDNHAAWLESFVLWRTGRSAPAGPPPKAVVCGSGTTGRLDLAAYLSCERALDAGADPATLLARVDAEIERSSETVPALLSLRALLLQRLGRRDDAVTAARGAWERSARERSDNLYARALAGVVAERHEVITGTPPPGVGG